MSKRTGKDALEAMKFGEVLLAAARTKAALHLSQSIGDERRRMHLHVGGGGGLRDVEANERQQQQFVVEHGERWWLVVVVDVGQ